MSILLNIGVLEKTKKTADGRCSDKEVKRRIALEKSAFHEMSRVLKSRNINMQTRKIILQCYIWATLLYGYETWTEAKTLESKLEAFEMRAYRRMLRVSWTKYKTNQEVLNMANTTSSISASWWQLLTYTPLILNLKTNNEAADTV